MPDLKKKIKISVEEGWIGNGQDLIPQSLQKCMLVLVERALHFVISAQVDRVVLLVNCGINVHITYWSSQKSIFYHQYSVRGCFLFFDFSYETQTTFRTQYIFHYSLIIRSLPRVNLVSTQNNNPACFLQLWVSWFFFFIYIYIEDISYTLAQQQNYLVSASLVC